MQVFLVFISFLIVPFIILNLLGGIISLAWTLLVMTFWCMSVLFLFVKNATEISLISLLLWSYGIATGPWAFMASKENDNPSSGIIVLFCQLTYILICLIILSFKVNIFEITIIFMSIMIIPLTVQLIVSYLSEKAVLEYEHLERSIEDVDSI